MDRSLKISLEVHVVMNGGQRHKIFEQELFSSKEYYLSSL